MSSGYDLSNGLDVSPDDGPDIDMGGQAIVWRWHRPTAKHKSHLVETPEGISEVRHESFWMQAACGVEVWVSDWPQLNYEPGTACRNCERSTWKVVGRANPPKEEAQNQP